MDAAGGEPVERSRGERGDRRSSFVLQQLDVGQARMIIDDCVSEVIAPARPLLGRALLGTRMSGRAPVICCTWTPRAMRALSVLGTP